MVEAKTADHNEVHEGDIVECTVEQIMPYGVFVRISANGKKGMIHISELSYSFVKNIGDILKIDDRIKAKIISIDERGRTDLSLKQTLPQPEKPGKERRPSPQRPAYKTKPPKRESGEFKDYHEMKANMRYPSSGSDESFEQKMSAFLKTSEAKITDLNTRNSSSRSSRSRSSKGRRGSGSY